MKLDSRGQAQTGERCHFRTGNDFSRALLAFLACGFVLAGAAVSEASAASPQFRSCSQLEKVVPLPDGSAIAAGVTWTGVDCDSGWNESSRVKWCNGLIESCC